MPDNHLFEYAVIRFVPRVEREEFLNVGVILYCRQKQFLDTIFAVDEKRLAAFSSLRDSSTTDRDGNASGTDKGATAIKDLRAYLEGFAQIARGGPGSGPIGLLDTASRFRWLTATRSTIIQSSKVHPGLCADPALALERLFAKMVL